MSIEQKAREIVVNLLKSEGYNLQAAAAESGGWDEGAAVKAARLGIIEGRIQAFEEAAQIAADEGAFEVLLAIRALIEEQKL